MAASHGKPGVIERWAEARDAIYNQIMPPSCDAIAPIPRPARRGVTGPCTVRKTSHGFVADWAASAASVSSLVGAIYRPLMPLPINTAPMTRIRVAITVALLACRHARSMSSGPRIFSAATA